MSQKPSCLRILLLASAIAAGGSPTSLAKAQSGDMNCDGAVNTADIPLFVDALLATGGFGGCDINRADMNADTLINGLDTLGFVAALLSVCAPGTTWCGGYCAWLDSDLLNCGNCGHVCAAGYECYGGECHEAVPP